MSLTGPHRDRSRLNCQATRETLRPRLFACWCPAQNGPVLAQFNNVIHMDYASFGSILESHAQTTEELPAQRSAENYRGT
jgi:hypothetical protein